MTKVKQAYEEISSGASPEDPEVLRVLDSTNLAAIHYAVLNADLAAARTIYGLGGDLALQTDDGHDALDMAIDIKDVRLIEFLVEKGFGWNRGRAGGTLSTIPQ